jgi:hypothetical protein
MLMMVFLILDIPGDYFRLRWFDRKYSITPEASGPIKSGIAFSFCFDPFGRLLLNLLKQCDLSHFFGKQA